MQTLEEIKELVTLKAKENDFDPKFLHALVMTESRYNPWATRYELDYRWLYKVEEMAKVVGVQTVTMKVMQQTSYGICQVMSAVAYEYGFRGFGAQLCDPVMSLDYACMHLKKKIKQYSLKDPIDIYHVYNAGSVQKKNGEYTNKKNVDRFVLNLSRIK